MALLEGDADPVLPPGVIQTRRRATASSWSAGVAGWNVKARQKMALLREVGHDAMLVLTVIQLFAADFTAARFGDGLDASEAVFPGHLLLERARVEGSLRLDGAQLMGAVHARGLKVGRDLAGEGALFVGPVSLPDIEVGGATRFNDSTFMSEVDVDRGAFHREVWLRRARFDAAVNMRHCELFRDASLGCRYEGPARFDGTHFADTVSFEGALFRRDLSLDACVFDGLLLLAGIRIEGRTTLADARFAGRIRPSLDLIRERTGPREMLTALRRAFNAG